MANVTVKATAHGLTCLVLDEAGTAPNSAVVVATVRQPLFERDGLKMYNETDRSQNKWKQRHQNLSGVKLPAGASWSNRLPFSIGTATPALQCRN